MSVAGQTRHQFRREDAGEGQGSARPSLPETVAAGGLVRRRSVPHLLLGAGLVIACGLVFGVAVLHTDPAVPVLALARAVPAGQVLTAQDVTTVKVQADPGAGLLGAGERERVVGQTLRVPLPAGQLLVRANLGAGAWPPAGQSVVAVPVTAGHLPVGVVEGAAVRVITTASSLASPDESTASSAQIPAAGPDGSATGPLRASVVHVETADTSGVSVVSLLMASSDAVQVASTPQDRLALVLQGAGG